MMVKSAASQDILTGVQIQHRKGAPACTAGPGEGRSLLPAFGHSRKRGKEIGVCLHHADIFGYLVISKNLTKQNKGIERRKVNKTANTFPHQQDKTRHAVFWVQGLQPIPGFNANKTVSTLLVDWGSLRLLLKPRIHEGRKWKTCADLHISHLKDIRTRHRQWCQVMVSMYHASLALWRGVLYTPDASHSGRWPSDPSPSTQIALDLTECLPRLRHRLLLSLLLFFKIRPAVSKMSRQIRDWHRNLNQLSGISSSEALKGYRFLKSQTCESRRRG